MPTKCLLAVARVPNCAPPTGEQGSVSPPRTPPIGGGDPFFGCRHRGWWQHQGPDRKIFVSFVSNEPRRSQSQLAIKQMTTGLPAKPANPRAAGLPPSQPGKARRSAQPSRKTTGINPQTDGASCSPARRHCEATTVSKGNPGIIKPIATEAATGGHIAAENEQCKERVIQVNISAALQSFNEAKNETLAHLAEVVQPPRWVSEFKRSHARALRHSAEVQQEIFKRVAQINTPSSSPLVGLRLGDFDAPEAFSAIKTISELNIPLRIHALPRLQSPHVAGPQGCRDHLSEWAPQSPPEAPEQADGWLDDNLNDEGRSKLLEQLSWFLRSEEISSDAREGIRMILAWWNRIHPQITSDQSLEFNLNLKVFLRALLSLSAAPDGHQKLSSGLLVPRSHVSVPTPDLAPDVYTTKQLAKKVHTTMDTLKRHARIASAEGPLPQPLPSFPGYFVVEMSDPKGGKGCGWKFQEERKPEDT